MFIIKEKCKNKKQETKKKQQEEKTTFYFGLMKYRFFLINLFLF